MRVLDLEKLDYIKVDDSEIVELRTVIDQNNLMELQVSEIIQTIQNALSTFNVDRLDKERYYHFIIEVNDKNFPISGYNDLRSIVGNCFGKSLLIDEMREREARLSIPEIIKSKCKLGLLVQLQLVNKKTKINKFACSIVVNGNKKLVV